MGRFTQITWLCFLLGLSALIASGLFIGFSYLFVFTAEMFVGKELDRKFLLSAGSEDAGGLVVASFLGLNWLLWTSPSKMARWLYETLRLRILGLTSCLLFEVQPMKPDCC
jgi:hypothetical protein